MISNKMLSKKEYNYDNIDIYNITKNVFIYKHRKYNYTGYVASFELDWTLIRPKGNKYIITEKYSNIIFYQDRIDQLYEYQKAGYSIIIITQQNYNMHTNASIKAIKTIEILENNNIYPLIMVINDNKKYNKPKPISWNYLFDDIKFKYGFYCSNYGGRSYDFSSRDKEYIENINNDNVIFKYPEEIFKHDIHYIKNLDIKEYNKNTIILLEGSLASYNFRISFFFKYINKLYNNIYLVTNHNNFLYNISRNIPTIYLVSLPTKMSRIDIQDLIKTYKNNLIYIQFTGFDIRYANNIDVSSYYNEYEHTSKEEINGVYQENSSTCNVYL